MVAIHSIALAAIMAMKQMASPPSGQALSCALPAPPDPMVPLGAEVDLALDQGRELAVAAHLNWISAPQIALGILRSGSNTVTREFERLRVDTATLGHQLRLLVHPGRRPSLGPDLPYDSIGKAVLGGAMHAARARSSAEVSTLDLLVGLERCGSVGVRQALKRAGVDSARTHRLPGRHEERAVHHLLLF